MIKKSLFKRLIKDFELKRLFIELGWNNYNERQSPIILKDRKYLLQPIAQKNNFVILHCYSEDDKHIPPYSIRKQIERKVAKRHFEHLIIFTDKQQNEQRWQLTIREEGKPLRTCETKYYSHQAPELIHQKLSGLFFSWDEEDNIGIVDVKKRVEKNFSKNAEKITKKFYKEFKKQHTAFIGFIEGITEKVDKDWYASLMLNRLMFIYFIQKKGFLDDNKNYLADKLKQTKETRGEDEFYSFYQDFLKVLFHKGLGAKERPEKLLNEIGRIPYLNGGLFDVHEIEKKYTNIKIKDDAFEKLFAFFDEYEWHLDTRKESTGKEINPDVIGYIFEKYINDRASMGAYYTKEDITEYIGKNTIIPFVFDEVKRHYPKAFKPDEYLWQMLALSSDKYIYDAVKFGIPTEGDIFSDLPDEIKAGFRPDLEKKIVTDSEETHLWEIRKVWNKKAPAEIALPTEIYRELIERRKRYVEVKTKIKNGEMNKINDFITYNLDIRQFVQDIISDTDDPYLINHFYKAIKKVTVLDPTCGSGAFLFAALNILEPLYEGCIERMQNFTEEVPGKYRTFENILEDVNSPQHPNLKYFIYKSIILNNLFGVDIMNEAVEIAKLRLFLKLVSTADVNYKKENYGLEPLPDIDFNIRCGNTLVGFTKLEEIEEYIKKKGEETIIFEDEHDKINAITDKADIVAKLFADFRQQQAVCDAGSAKYRQTKKEVTKRLNELNEELNQYLAFIYGIDAELKPKQYEEWKASHQPFHWFSEFYEIMNKGGFDVIIGNPPYVEYSKVRKTYKLLNFLTEKAGNLYAYIIERSLKIQAKNGFNGMIIQLSAFCTPRMNSFQNYWLDNSKFRSIAFFDDRPGKLFEGLEHIRVAICIMQKGEKKESLISTTNYIKFYSENRINLFDSISLLSNNNSIKSSSILKVNNNLEHYIIDKLWKSSDTIETFTTKKSNQNFVYYGYGFGYFGKILNFKSFFNGEKVKVSTGDKFLFINKEFSRDIFVALMNSNIFYWFYVNFSDGHNFTKNVIKSIPFNIPSKDILKILNIKNSLLMADLQDKSKRKFASYKSTGSVEYDEFFPKKSKPIIDEIDTVLAQHYGFTEAELDFIINYDIKYRMGKELENYVNGKL